MNPNSHYQLQAAQSNTQNEYQSLSGREISMRFDIEDKELLWLSPRDIPCGQ